MKQLSIPAFYIIVITAFFAIPSCSKKDPPILEPETTFQFNANGIEYEWNGDYNTVGYGSVLIKDTINSVYKLIGSSVNSTGGSGNYLLLSIRAADLSVNTYNITISDSVFAPGPADQVCFLFDNDIPFVSYRVGDFARISITKIHDQYYDGSFSALMTKADSTFEKLNITNGRFKNVKFLE
jgi:hypothetical protein